MAKLPENLTSERVIEIRSELVVLHSFLLHTFFSNQTGIFWMYLEYPSIFEIGDGATSISGEPIIRDISRELGDKIRYLREVHLFLEKILLLITGCELAVEENPAEFIIAEITNIGQTVNKLRANLDQLLNSPDSFAVNIDKQTGQWSVEDVQLDSSSILSVWDKCYQEIVDQD